MHSAGYKLSCIMKGAEILMEGVVILLYLQPVSLPEQVLPLLSLPEQTDSLTLTVWTVVTITVTRRI